ncbi:MAG TPA: ABC transporter permease [Saprospiraceae bacterium]|nr:ABC transporter permease [Saprospiraceae bacterium]
MVIQLGWKNIWRNTLRSGVVMSAVATGIWALVFILGFSQGMVSSYINVSIENRTSHIQIHHPEFVDDPEMDFIIKESYDIMEEMAQMEEVKMISHRLLAHGLVSTAAGGQGAVIRAVDPLRESQLTRLDEKIIDGEYLDGNRRNPVLISQGLARKLGVSMDQHVVINIQSKSGDLVAGRFRITGIYGTGNPRLDDVQIYVRYDDLSRLGEMDDRAAHEIAISLVDLAKVEDLKERISLMYPQYSVRTYEEISPDLAMYNEQIKTSMSIVITVIMLALLFGIINTMLMAVLERSKELGMLMAIGMNRIKLFIMIMMESLFMCSIAVPVGLVLGYSTMSILGKRGIDLSNWASGLEQFGMQSIIKPELSTMVYVEIVIALVLTSLIAGIYPALKAIRTQPVEALRKI